MVPTHTIQGNLESPCPAGNFEVPTVERDTPIEHVVEAFLRSQIPNGKTARGYRRHLRQAFEIMGVDTLTDLEMRKLIAYRNYIVSDGRGKATHAQAIIAVRSCLQWVAAMDGHDLRMDAVNYHLKVPKVEVIRPHETLVGAELPAFINAARISGPRDHALVMVALGSGVRVAELVFLDIRDFRHDGAGGAVIHVREGKGGKDRMIPVRHEVQDAVEAYLRWSHRKRGDLGPLFLSEDRAMGSRENWRLTTKSASRIIKACAAEAGITKRISPHALRHTFAFTTYLHCRNLVAVQKLLGHATIATTQRYVSHLDQLDLRLAIPATLSGLPAESKAKEDAA